MKFKKMFNRTPVINYYHKDIESKLLRELGNVFLEQNKIDSSNTRKDLTDLGIKQFIFKFSKTILSTQGSSLK
jgi:hypothetical protein